MRASGGLAVIAALLPLLLFFSTSAKRSRPKADNIIFQWLEILDCPETKAQNLTTELRYLKSGDVYADTAWTVTIPAQTLQVHQHFTSCREDYTACEHFMNWDPPMDGCTFISAKKMVWSPCFANIQPPFVCPVKTGRYVNKNWTVDKEILKLLPFPRNRVYQNRIELVNENNQLSFCFILVGIWKSIKNRD